MKSIKKTTAIIMITAVLGLNFINSEISFAKTYTVNAAVTTEESAEQEEVSSSEIETTTSKMEDESTTSNIDEDTTTSKEETTTKKEEETTTPKDYIVIDDVYKVKKGVLVEYLGNKKSKKVTTLTIPTEIKEIEDNVFENAKYVETIKFESGSKLKTLGKYVFRKCYGLKKITLPEGIQDLGYRTFAQCTSLKSLTIPTTVIKGNQIFGTKATIVSVKFKKGIVTIPENILRYAYTLEEVKMYSGVKIIDKRAFYKCENLKTINLPNTIESIGTSAFEGCISIKKITLPDQLEKIGWYSFKGCTSLLSVKLKKTIVSIGDEAFANNPLLTIQVYANSYGKGYVLENKLAWEYAPSEIERQNKGIQIKNALLLQISKHDVNKYKLKELEDYVPQGICVIKNYVVVSMYHRYFYKKSLILIYNKKTGKFIKKAYLPSIDHIGAVTNVEGRLVISLNNISATDYVAIINYSQLKKIKNGKTINYKYTVKLPGYADFAAYDGKYFWAGRSANISYASMYGYKVKIKNKKLTFTKKYSYIVPANTQGLIVEKGKGGNRKFILSQSYGVIANSSIYTYEININKESTLGKPTNTKLIPSMVEGIVKHGRYMYMVFESAAKKYCGDENYTTEIQMKNVVRIKYKNFKYLYED